MNTRFGRTLAEVSQINLYWTLFQDFVHKLSLTFADSFIEVGISH